MRKLSSYLFALVAFTGLTFFTSCTDDAEDPVAELEPATGTVQISFLNFPGTGNVTTTAAPGDLVAVAVQVQKTAGGNRPQTLRVYETKTLNTRGTQVGKDIDLRNTDDAQIKNVNYTVSGSGTTYLYFEVDESNKAFSRKVLTINATGTAGVNTYTNVVLGAQLNAAPSRISSATGQLYTACDASANINDIDITYAVLGTSPTILSNPERQVKELSTDAKNCDDAATSTAGGPNTKFSKANTADFNGATDTTLGALTISGTSESVVVVKGDIIAFETEDGRKGLIKVEDVVAGTSGSLKISVKVQR